jgi:thiosulfate/3-mercaptopyruvate sulfurtransferase
VYTTLIDAERLAGILDDCVLVDCRHDLLDPSIGPAAYAEGHLPRAWFLHQDTKLAGPRNGRNGRHPLPDRETLRGTLEAIGLSDDRQLIVYDSQGGMFAGRLWWLARWLGHRAVAMLDGGLPAWTQAGFPLTRDIPDPASVRRGSLSQRPSLATALDANGVLANLASRERLMIDARSAERYRGEVEPIDPVAGHIPGAFNRPFQENLRPDGRFKPAPVLRQEFETLLAGRKPAEVLHQCGSGVSACHNILAMEMAGLEGSALYPGSWSEWCADPSRPVATGANP